MVDAASERSAPRLVEPSAALLLAERRGCVRDVAHTTKRLRYCDSDRLQHITPNGKTVANYVYGASNCLANAWNTDGKLYKTGALTLKEMHIQDIVI